MIIKALGNNEMKSKTGMEQQGQSLYSPSLFRSCLLSPPPPYTDHAGLEISVNSRIAWLFSRQIAISNAGLTLALESMGGKRLFAVIFKYWSNVQTVSEKKFYLGQ